MDKKKTAYESWKKKNTLFGRDTDLRWLSWLTHPGGVVPVWGMSGVGKSYLIQHFYREKQSREFGRYKFGWVNVSRPFHLRDFCRSLHSELNPAPQMMSTIKDPIQGRGEFLLSLENPYFLVIDGLQSTEEWDLIKSIFQLNTSSSNESKKGSNEPKNTVIIITNEESVAHYCATKRKSVWIWNVKGLEVGNAIELFDKV